MSDARCGWTATSDSGWVTLGTAVYGYPAAVRTDGAVNYWRLGEASGTVLADNGASPHAGTFYGGVTLAQTGAVGGNTAVQFNGTTRYGKVATSPLVGAGALTLEGWVNGNGNSWSDGHEMVVNAGNAHYVSIRNGKVFGSLQFAAQSTFEGGTVPNTGWHHVVLTWTNGDYMRLYLDGALSATSSTIVSGTLATGGSVGIGTFGPDVTPSLWFKGFLDEIAVYPTALTGTQVAAHYALRTAPGTSGSGVVFYTVAANTAFVARSAMLTVAGQSVFVTQAAEPCAFSISPSTLSFGPGGSSGTLAVSTQAGCQQGAESDVSWVTTAPVGYASQIMSDEGHQDSGD